MTWKDIKLATLQKMFSADGSTIPNDESVKDYIAGMPYVANEALNLLSTAGKYIIKSVDITKDTDEKSKHNMNDLVDDYYMLDSVFYDEEEITNYSTMKDNIVLRGKGTFTVFYKAYPTEITSTTVDSYELPVAREVAVLLPLYMASQLYKDDDNGIATSYRNEFEVAFEKLVNESDVNAQQFTSESGWI